MSERRTLRALVNARLSAAAEEIFALFETTIAEYEYELRRSKQKDEQRRKVQQLDSALGSTHTGVQMPWLSPGPSLKTLETQIKEEIEEQSLKQEDEQLPVPVPESCVVYVKAEGLTHLHSNTEGHTQDSSEAAQMETEADAECYSQVQTRATSSAALNSQRGSKKHQCPFCTKSFKHQLLLERHIRVHTGERPFICSVCEKAFTQKMTLDTHLRIHTREKPFSCSSCDQTFARQQILEVHMRIHTGVRPYSCSLCDKSFGLKSTLRIHMRTHTGDKPYSCSFCNRTFAQKTTLNTHRRTHTGEKPYSCSLCDRSFSHRSSLNHHMRAHSRRDLAAVQETLTASASCFK